MGERVKIGIVGIGISGIQKYVKPEQCYPL